MKLKLLNKSSYNRAIVSHRQHDFLPTSLDVSSTRTQEASNSGNITRENIESQLERSEWARSNGVFSFSSADNSNVSAVTVGTNPNGKYVEKDYKFIELTVGSNQDIVDLEFGSNYFNRDERKVKKIDDRSTLEQYRGTSKLFLVSRKLRKADLARPTLNKLDLADIPKSSALVISIGTQRQHETTGNSVVLVDCDSYDSDGLDFGSLLDPKVFSDDSRQLKGGEFSDCSLLKLYSYNDAKDLASSISISTNRTDESVFNQLLGVQQLKDSSAVTGQGDDETLGCLILTSHSSYISKILVGRISDLSEYYRVIFQMADVPEELPFYAVYPSINPSGVNHNDSAVVLQLLSLAIKEDNAVSRVQKILRLKTNFRLLFGDTIGVYASSDVVPDRGKNDIAKAHSDVLYRQKGELLSYAKRIKERYPLSNKGEVDGLKSSLFSAIKDSQKEFRGTLPVQTPFSVFNNKTGYTYCAVPVDKLGKDKDAYLVVGSDSDLGIIPVYPMFSYGRRSVTKISKVASGSALESTGLIAINNIDQLKALRSEDTQGHGLSGVGSFRLVFSDKSSTGSAYYLGSVVLGNKGYYFRSSLDTSLEQILSEIDQPMQHIPVFVDEDGILEGELRVYSYYLHTNLVMQAVLSAMDQIGIPAYVDKYSWDVEELRSAFGSATSLRALYGDSKVPEFKPISKGYISAGLVRELGAFNNIVANANFGTLVNFVDEYRKLGKLIEALVDRRLLIGGASEVFEYKGNVYRTVPAVPIRDLLLAQESAHTGVIDCISCQPFNNCLIFD